MKLSTSFGTLEILLKRNGEVVTELLYFEREGRGHTHDSWENCYILSGHSECNNFPKNHECDLDLPVRSIVVL